MKKRKAAALTAAVLCISLSGIHAALAYRTDSASAENNLSFIGSEGLNAILSEPSWNPENGILVVPNMIIPKNPQITNTSTADLDELVAIRMEFRYSESCPDSEKRGELLSAEDMACVNAVYDIDYSSDVSGAWVRFRGEDEADPVQHFYYGEVLERNYPSSGETTEPLFTRLKVPSDIGNMQYSGIQKIGGFDIVLTGSVLQHMHSETQFGLTSAKLAYEAGLFTFESDTQD